MIIELVDWRRSYLKQLDVDYGADMARASGQAAMWFDFLLTPTQFIMEAMAAKSRGEQTEIPRPIRRGSGRESANLAQ